MEFAVDEKTEEVVQMAPRTMSSLFNGERKVVYALMPKGIHNLKVTLRASVGGTEVSAVVASTDTGTSSGTVKKEIGQSC